MIDEVANIEKVEAELDNFIERRAREAKDGRSRVNAEAAAERMAAASRARRYREALLWQKLDYHRSQLEAHTATFSRILDRHRVGIRLVEEALGITSDGERKSA